MRLSFAFRRIVSFMNRERMESEGVTDIRKLHQRALDAFGEKVMAVREDQWHDSTPCSEWDVHTLVNHLVSESRWMAPLLAGKTIADVGEALDGDLLGSDAMAAWRDAAREAADAVQDPGAMDRIVHVSFGEISGEEYTTQVFTDLVIHGWDLARGIGADERMDPELLEVTYEKMAPMIAQFKGSGLYGPDVQPPPGADLQTRLLAMVGRVA
jgi:uncharacterized protein (TIGR03086 family)